MTNWGYKAVRKVLQTFGGAELAQQQSGRITGEPGNPEVATLARRAGAESCVLLKNTTTLCPWICLRRWRCLAGCKKTIFM